MKKLFLIGFILISVFCFGQPTTTYPILGVPKSKALIQGWVQVDSGFINARKDTLLAPIAVGEQRFRVADSTLYIAKSTTSPRKWYEAGGGGWTQVGNFLYNSNSGNIAIGTSSDAGNKLRVVGSVRFDLGNDSLGDMYYRDVDGDLKRLPAGDSGQILRMYNGLPTWRDTSTFSVPNDFVRYQFLVDSTPNAPVAGDSVWVSPSTLNGRLIKITIDGILQRDSVTWGTGTGYNYKYDGTSDTIKIHPAFVGGEHVQVETFPRSDWTFSGFAGYDADAQAYFTAEGITSIPVKNAINTFIVSCKAGANTWSRLKAVYLFFGSGLKNAVSPGTYDLTTTNSPTFADATGASFDGVNDYLNTNLIPSTALAMESESHFFYIKSSTDDKPISGAIDGSNSTYLFPRSSGNFVYRLQNAGDINAGANASSPGRYIIRLRNTVPNERITKNGSQIYSNNQVVTAPVNTYPITIAALNNVGSIISFNSCVIGIYGIGLSLTDTQMSELDAAMSAFISAMGRN